MMAMGAISAITKSGRYASMPRKVRSAELRASIEREWKGDIVEAMSTKAQARGERVPNRMPLGPPRKTKPEEPYETSARAERAQRYAGAIAALRSFVRARCNVEGEALADPFGQLLTAWVEDAVSRGWIRLSEGGYAEAQLPEHWGIRDLPFGPDDPRWASEVRRRQQADHAAVMADWPRLAIRTADSTEAKALSQLLGLAELQYAALRALGVPMIEVGMLESIEASRFAADLALVGHAQYRGVPEEVFERVRPLVEKFPGGIPTWEVALITAVQTAAIQRLGAREKVDWVLEALQFYAKEGIPAPFASSSADQREAAARLMAGLRLGSVKKEFRPPGSAKGAGPPLSERGAAAAFAGCFGVRMQAKSSRAKRRKN